MIDIKPKIHDKFTVEFKIGYHAEPKELESDFSMNMWVFIPNSLDINPQTYTKDAFYRDVRSNLRMIIPIFELSKLAIPDEVPMRLLSESCRKLAEDSKQKNLQRSLHHIKMYASIAKSSIRDAFDRIIQEKDPDQIMLLSKAFITDCEAVLQNYRELGSLLTNKKKWQLFGQYYYFGDEFISNVVELNVLKLSEFLSSESSNVDQDIHQRISTLLLEEQKRRYRRGYRSVQENDTDKNNGFVLQSALLKKFVESDLYLEIRRKSNSFLQDQVIFSIAAGLSMLVATVLSFFFQEKYGSYTVPLLVAIVLIYILKDRLKDLTRYYFSRKIKNIFFDNNINISLNKLKIGRCKEGMDFLPVEKLPDIVQEIHGNVSLLESLTIRRDEYVILYRKRVQLNTKEVSALGPYVFPGVNDIIRYNLSEYFRKMDNPEISLYVNNPAKKPPLKVIGGKLYRCDFIIEFVYQNQVRFVSYRIFMNKDGIKRIVPIK